jgi:hypothetical protein
MKPNEGTIDRAIRLVIAAMAAIGAIPLLTGLSGYCPLYTVFRINTRRS